LVLGHEELEKQEQPDGASSMSTVWAAPRKLFYERFRLKKHTQLDVCKPASKARPHLNIKNQRGKYMFPPFGVDKNKETQATIQRGSTL